MMSIDSSNGEGGGSLTALFSMTFVNTIFFSSNRLGGGGGGVFGFVIGVVGHLISPALEDLSKGGGSSMGGFCGNLKKIMCNFIKQLFICCARQKLFIYFECICYLLLLDAHISLITPKATR